MGNCFTDCIEVFCPYEYERIPDDEQDGKESRSSVTTITNHSDIHPWDETKNQENVLPPQLRQFYAMGELVGIGTTSKVYKVQYLINGTWGSSDKQPLVCKIIDKKGIIYNVDDGDVDPLLEQLSREVEILKRIHHPNIVTFYDYMETKDKLYIITERLDGGELFEYILQHGPLPEGFACKILFGVFSAVAYLHERGVVHRDIKAENLIFFKDADGNDALKLIDFGFSTVLRHQLTGSFMGTGGYIAPEIRQNKNYSTSVDSWSLGVLLYCTLSARLPFGISIDSLPSSIDECRGMFALVFPAKIWGHISDPCRDLITRLLEIDPNVRLSAKDALRHPWFSSQFERMKRSLGSPHSICQSDWDGSPGVDIELPALHSSLRRTQSMSELERRGSEPISVKTRTGSSPYPLAELESVPAPDRPLSWSISERKSQRKGLFVGEEESLLGPNKDLGSSYQSCAGSCSSSSVGSRSGERWASSRSRSGTDEGVFEHKCYALWEETHKPSAGELFYTTYQRGLSSSHRQHS